MSSSLPVPGNLNRAKTSPESTDGSFAPKTQTAPGPAAGLVVVTVGNVDQVVCQAGGSDNHTRCPLGGPCTPVVEVRDVPGMTERGYDPVKMVLPAGMDGHFSPEQVYAYDIETHNDEANGFNGLDPRRSYITEIVVVTDPSIAGGGKVFSGSEEEILRDFTDFTASLPPGLMVDWNGAFFDGAFVDHRARQHESLNPTWVQVPRPDIAPKYDALPTSVTPESPTGGWSTLFAGDGSYHAALDISHAYQQRSESMGAKWSLKPVCAAEGIEMYEIDRTRLHEYTPEQRRDYVLSDGIGTRELALRALDLD